MSKIKGVFLIILYIMSRKKFSYSDRLPFLVLYESTESWYYEPGQKPIAVFLKPDEIAVYARDLPKLRYAKARDACFSMTEQNLFYQLPTFEELKLLLENHAAFDRVLRLVGADPLKPAKYWSRSKAAEKNCRRAVSFLPKGELVLHEMQYAFARPFLVL